MDIGVFVNLRAQYIEKRDFDTYVLDRQYLEWNCSKSIRAKIYDPYSPYMQFGGRDDEDDYILGFRVVWLPDWNDVISLVNTSTTERLLHSPEQETE